MRLFILFIPFLLIYSSDSFSQDADQFNKLPTEQRHRIKKRIRGLSVKDKIYSFTVFDKKYTPEINKSIGGIMLGASNTNQKLDNRKGLDVLKIANLKYVKEYHGLPFPSINTRKKANKPVPAWLPVTFGGNYLTDIDTALSRGLYYGLDSSGVYINTTPYHSWDSLLSSILKHDLIYAPFVPEVLTSHLSKIKVKRQQERSIDDKLKTKFIQETAKINQAQAIPKEKDIIQWVWQAYESANDIRHVNGVLPVSALDSINICLYSFNAEHFYDFSSKLNNYTTVPLYSPDSSPDKDLARLSAYDLVIIPATALVDEEIEFVQALALQTKVSIIGFGYDATTLIDNSEINLLHVPEDNWLSQSIAAQTLFGVEVQDDSSSRLAYGTPQLVGMNPSILKLIDSVVAEALEEQAIPGCQILVAKDGVVVFEKAYGYQTYDSTYEISNRTKYDLASITKVLATTQAIMYLLEHDSITLDTPLSNYLEYLNNTNKKDITIRQIMAHQAGLYPYYPFWKKAKEELKLDDQSSKDVQVGKSVWVNSAVGDSVLSWAAISDLLAERIDTITHDQYFYSDIGFFLLKDLIEGKTAMPMDKFLYAQLYKPIGTSLVFNPTCLYPVIELAPTEKDDLLRHEVVQGFVHDRNAALLGGVSGQAGLFGNANDVAIMLQLQLNGGCYGGQRYFETSTIKQFISRQYDNNRRGLGWDMPGTEPDGPVSELASDETFGHTGFTGGSIWADPKESLIFVFLSNRIYPSVENTKLIDMNIRTRIQDIVYRSILK